MTNCTQKPTLGRMPRRLDRFAQITTDLNSRRYLRFVEGGDGDGAGGDGDGAGGDGDGALGDAGKQALDRMKAERAAAKTEAAAARAEAQAFKDLGLTVDEIKALQKAAPPAASEDDVEKRIAKALAENDKVNKAKSDARSRAAEVRAQAAELGFIKPAQALALLDSTKLAEVAVTDDGDADAAAVKKLLEELKTDSPHLLKPTDHTAHHRDAGIGASGSGAQPDVRPGADRLRQAYANTSK